MLNEPSSQYIKRLYRNYARYVNTTRAIPFVGDGFKLSQRIGLYLLMNRAEKIKTASLVGQMMQGYYNHGDDAAEDTLTRLASPYYNNIPLITADSDGGFGSRSDPQAISAGRYTNIKRSKAAQKFLYQDSDILPMVNTKDGTADMPAFFLPLIPTVLLNGVSGAGVGYKTEILPRGFTDLVKAVLAVLDGKNCPTLVPTYMGTGITVIPDRERKATEDTTRWISQAGFRREGSNKVQVTDLPMEYSTLDKYKEYLNELIEQKLIVDYDDWSANEIKIEIKFSRIYLMESSDEDIVEILRLRSHLVERIVVLKFDGTIGTYACAEDVVKDFVDWRFGFYQTRYEHLRSDEERKALYWDCVVACHKDGLPGRVKTIKNGVELRDQIQSILDKSGLEPIEGFVGRIADIPLYRWTSEGEKAAQDASREAKAMIKEYTAILKSPERRKAIFRDEVAAVKFKDI